MDAAEALWQARVSAALSQRELAARAGVSRSAVGAIESGRNQPGWQTMKRLLTACDLELAVATAPPSLDEADERFLRASTSARLFASLGGLGAPSPQLPVWRYLRDLRSRARVSLPPSACLGIWLRQPAPQPLPVVVHCAGFPAGDWPGLAITTDDSPPAPHLIPVGLQHWRPELRVYTPVVLALQPEVSAHSARLRAVARYLHHGEGLDRAGRHRPAHRVSDPAREEYDIQHRHAYGPIRDLPTPTDRREWRASGPVGFPEWLARHRYPEPWRKTDRDDIERERDAG